MGFKAYSLTRRFWSRSSLNPLLCHYLRGSAKYDTIIGMNAGKMITAVLAVAFTFTAQAATIWWYTEFKVTGINIEDVDPYEYVGKGDGGFDRGMTTVYLVQAESQVDNGSILGALEEGTFNPDTFSDFLEKYDDIDNYYDYDVDVPGFDVYYVFLLFIEYFDGVLRSA